jgi:uncharacterized protein YukE
VNPEQLRASAGRIRQVAAEMRGTGRNLLAQSQGLPSYEGQFGPKVHAIAMEAFARLNPLAEEFETLAGELERVAECFEGADQAGSEAFLRLAASFTALAEGLHADIAAWLQIALFPSHEVLGWLRLGSLFDPHGEEEPEDPPWWAPILVEASELWEAFDQGTLKPIRDLVLGARETWDENRHMAATIALYYMAQGWFWYDEHVNELVHSVYEEFPKKQSPGLPQDGPITAALETLSARDSNGNPVSPVGAELVELIEARGGVTVLFTDSLTGGDAGIAPMKGLIFLPERYMDPAVQRQPENAALIAHELAHVLQRDLPAFPDGFPTATTGSWPFSPDGFDPFNLDYGVPLVGDFTLYMEVQSNLVGKTVEYDLIQHAISQLPPGQAPHDQTTRRINEIMNDLATYVGDAGDAAAYVLQDYRHVTMYQGEMVREVILGARIPPGGWEHWLGEQGFSQEGAIHHIRDLAGQGTPEEVYLSGMLEDPNAGTEPPSSPPGPTPEPDGLAPE